MVVVVCVVAGGRLLLGGVRRVDVHGGARVEWAGRRHSHCLTVGVCVGVCVVGEVQADVVVEAGSASTGWAEKMRGEKTHIGCPW